ncbi:MAG TPA: HTTM domain-containing protein, partial [bacterium]|nr:HTTM domain-containing protein [bacterium]
MENLLAFCLIVYVLFWDFAVVHFKFGLPPQGEWFARLSGLEQGWGMFSPPMTDDGWYVIPGKLKNGKEIDLFKGGAPLSWEKPAVVRTTYKNERWRKYMMNLWYGSNADYRLYYGRYLCRDWNSRHQGDEQLDSFKIYFMREDTLPDKKTAPPVPVMLWKHWCFEVPKEELEANKP